MPKALSSKPSVKARALPWLNLSPVNARMKQPKSRCWEWALSVSAAAAQLHLAPHTARGLQLLCSWYVQQGLFFFAMFSLQNLHFRAILRTPLLQKVLSIQCHFSDWTCLSNLWPNVVIPRYHKVLDALVWTAKNWETWSCCLHPHSHHWHQSQNSHHNHEVCVQSILNVPSAPEQSPSLVHNRANTSQPATRLSYLQRSGFYGKLHWSDVGMQDLGRGWNSAEWGHLESSHSGTFNHTWA